MAQITPEDQAFIASNPLSPSLRSLGVSLRPPNKAPSEASSDDTNNNNAYRDAIAKVLTTLLVHPAAPQIRGSTSSPLNAQLAVLYAHLYKSSIDFSLFEPLVEAVVSHASDLEIWATALQLVDSFARITPPPPTSLPNSFLGTPFTRSSASHQSSDQTRRDLEQPLRHELAGNTFECVPEFFARYFENKDWNSDVSKICEGIREANDGDLLKGYPEVHSEDEVWTWLDDFQAKYLAESLNVYCRTTKKGQTNTETDRQVDVMIQPRGLATTERLDMSHAMVVGELTSSAKSSKWLSKFIQLSTYIRDAFAQQPTRLFIHAFLVFGSEMQLWIFDRSGAYSSETFNVFERKELFVRVLVAYALMSDEELGVNTHLERTSSGIHKTVTIKDAETGQDRIIQLTFPPFVFQRSIVSRGTTCFFSRDGVRQHVTKLSWRPAERRAESEHLLAARGLKNVAQLEGSCDITSVKELREGLSFKFKMRRRIPFNDLVVASAQSSPASQSGKRANTASSDDRVHKKPRPSSLQSRLAADSQASSSGQIQEPPQLFQNRILTCVVISPAGRPLSQFRSLKELLTGMRDAIRGHMSLFMDRRILHRDISENNIILTDPQEHGYMGALIDLDMAVAIDENGKNERSGSRVLTGTLEYMALEILQGGIDGLESEGARIEHTYRHDLESFFFVLIRLMTKYGWRPRADGEAERPPDVDPLREWYTGSIRNIYANKRGSLEVGAFDILVLSKVSPLFHDLKPLARDLRDALFSRGALWTGTDPEPQGLYDEMLQMFDDSIKIVGR